MLVVLIINLYEVFLQGNRVYRLIAYITIEIAVIVEHCSVNVLNDLYYALILEYIFDVEMTLFIV